MYDTIILHNRGFYGARFSGSTCSAVREMKHLAFYFQDRNGQFPGRCRLFCFVQQHSKPIWTLSTPYPELWTHHSTVCILLFQRSKIGLTQYRTKKHIARFQQLYSSFNTCQVARRTTTHYSQQPRQKTSPQR